MEMDVKSMEKGNGVKQTETIMAQNGKKFGALLNDGQKGGGAEEELLWSVLNVDAVRKNTFFCHFHAKGYYLKLSNNGVMTHSILNFLLLPQLSLSFIKKVI